MNPNVRMAMIVAVFVVLGIAIYAIFGGREAVGPAEDAALVAAPDTAKTEATELRFAPDSSSESATAVRDQSVAQPAAAGLRSGTVRRQGVSGFKETGDGLVTGLVLDRDGTPVPQATVWLDARDYMKPAAKPSETEQIETESDGQGQFFFDGLPSGSYVLSARKGSAVASMGVWVNVNQMVAEHVIQLRPAGRVAGVVQSAEGAAVEGAVIHPVEREGERENESWAEMTALRVESDAEGRFAIEALPEGRWKFLVTAEKHASVESQFIAVGTEDVEFVLEGGGTLTGRVIDANTQEAVPEVTVRAVYKEEGRDWHTAGTDALGVFAFPALRAGAYRVALDDDTLVITGDVPEAEVADGQETVQDLKVAPGGIVAGRVYDKETERPLSGAVVTAYSDEAEGGQPRESQPSDSDGRYTIEGLGEGRHRVSVQEVPGYPLVGPNGSQFVTASVGETIDGVDFPMDRGMSIAGQVVDASGAPVVGAVVYGRSEQWTSRDTTRSRAGGRFELQGFTYASAAYVWAEHEDRMSPTEGPLNLAELDKDGVKLTLSVSRDGRIEGRVVGASSESVSGAQIMARNDAYRFVQHLRATAADDGHFVIPRVPPGSYSFSVLPAGTYAYKSVPETITLEEGEQRDGVTLTLEDESGLSISGRVTGADGEPLDRANINVYGGPSHAYVHTGEDGGYEAKGLKEGEYVVQVSHHEHTGDRIQGVQAGSRNVDFRLQKNGAIEGQVVNARNNERIVNFEVQAVEGSRSNIESWMNQQFTRVHDPDGRFRLTRVAAGEATVFARAEGFAPSSQVVPNVPSGDTFEGVTIALEPSAAIEGSVVNEAGEPIVGALIFIGEVPDAWQRDRSAAAESGGDGRFELTSVPQEATVVSAYHPSYSPGSGAIAGDGVQIVMSTGGVVRGQVLEGREPLPNTQVNVRSDGPGGASEHTQTDAGGHYEFTSVTPGEVTVSSHLRITDNEWRSVDRPAVVAAGQETVVDLVFEPMNSSLEGRVFLGGRAVTSGSVSLRVQTGSSDESYHTELASDGSYRFEAIPAGQTTLTVRGQTANENGRTRLTLNLPPNTALQQDVELALNARIQGVLSGGQRALRGISAFHGEIVFPSTFTPESLQDLQRHQAAQEEVGPDGRYALTTLQPGTYTLVAWSVDGTDAASLANIQLSSPEVVELEEGEEATLDFQLP